MTEMFRSLHRAAALAAFPILLLAGCDGDSTGPEIPRESETEVAVVVSSTDRSLTVIPVDGPGAAYTIGVTPAQASPVTVAARGGIAVVPLGTYPYAAVVDLAARSVAYTVALPDNSGATGAAFLNDSIALVGNPNLNSVTPINVRRGTAGEAIPVGVYPQALVAQGGRVYVLNAHLEDFSPAAPGTITVIDGELRPAGTIQLSGYNPGDAAFDADGRLYVVNSGSYGAGNGSVSVVDVATQREVGFETGFGDFPGSIAAGQGRILLGVYGTGIIEWDPDTGTLVHGLDDPMTPGAVPPVSDLGFDSQGRLFVLTPGTCDEPGAAYRLSAQGQVEQEAVTGICPFVMAFTSLPES